MGFLKILTKIDASSTSDDMHQVFKNTSLAGHKQKTMLHSIHQNFISTFI